MGRVVAANNRGCIEWHECRDDIIIVFETATSFMKLAVLDDITHGIVDELDPETYAYGPIGKGRYEYKLVSRKVTRG